MPLWGASEADESLPKWLTETEKENVFADDRGWVYKHPNGDEEVLVAIGQLSGVDGSTGLGEPTIVSSRFAVSEIAQGETLLYYVFYNEPITITVGGGAVNVPCTVDGSPDTLDYSVSESDLSTGLVAFELDTTALTGDVVVAASASVAATGGATIIDATDETTAAEVTIGNVEQTVTITV
jgi:hypothetical protein